MIKAYNYLTNDFDFIFIDVITKFMKIEKYYLGLILDGELGNLHKNSK